MSNYPRPIIHVTLEIPELKGVIRIWIDREGEPYKIEVRTKTLMGYYEPEKLSKVIKMLAVDL